MKTEFDVNLLIQRIEMLCTQKGIKPTIVARESGAGTNSIANLKRGSMLSADKLAKIADYLDCSVDYLLGRTDTSMETAETYSINNQAQTFQGNQTNVVQTAPKQRDSMKDEFMQAFDELPLADKIEVMSFTMQKVKKGA